MLRITKSSDPIEVKQLVLCFYSPPGLGKSTLAFMADSPLLLDFDGGAYRAGNRGDVVEVSTWADVAQITGDDLKGHKTLVMDTAGRALDWLTAEIIANDPKLGRSGGALTLQGFGQLKARFIAFLRLVRSFGLDIILLAHSDEQRGNNDDLIERIDITGGSKGEIYKVADVMGRLAIRNGKRTLNFSPTDTTFGKNPAGLPILDVPDFKDEPRFLADVVQRIKDSLNRQTAAQKEVSDSLANWQQRFSQTNSPEELNALIPDVANTDERIRVNAGRLLVKVGKEKGFEWDKDAKQFVVKANGFNPLAQTTKDGITKKQADKIASLVAELKVEADRDASGVFRVPVTIDELSKEGADRYIADLTARIESEGAPF